MNNSDAIGGTISTIAKFSLIDYSIIITLLLVSLAIGIFIAFFRDGCRTNDDFLFGSYNMRSIPVALSLLARWFNGNIYGQLYLVYWNHFVMNMNFKLEIMYRFIYSQLSPIVILTMPVEIYSYGWQYTMFLPVLILVMLALCYIFLPILYHNKLDNCYTVISFNLYLDLIVIKVL